MEDVNCRKKFVERLKYNYYDFGRRDRHVIDDVIFGQKDMRATVGNALRRKLKYHEMQKMKCV